MPAPTSAPRRAPRKAKTQAPAASPAVSADPAMFYWLDFFHRYHENLGLRPVALSLLPEPVPVTETLTSRYVYEVAVKSGESGDEWVMIAWEIDIPGLRTRECASREEAMERFEQRNTYGKGVATVRLRPDCRPW